MERKVVDKENNLKQDGTFRILKYLLNSSFKPTAQNCIFINYKQTIALLFILS